MSNVLSAAIKDIDTRFSTGESNYDINNKIDTNALSALGAIKDMDLKSTTSRANNNMDTEVDASIFMSKAIIKINAELIMDGLYKANIIVGKKIYKSNLF